MAELDEKSMIAIQFCLANKVLDELSMEKNGVLVVGTTSEPLSKEVDGESVDSKVAYFSSPHA